MVFSTTLKELWSIQNIKKIMVSVYYDLFGIINEPKPSSYSELFLNSKRNLSQIMILKEIMVLRKLQIMVL